jgi:AcrR family transcriptional regulator
MAGTARGPYAKTEQFRLDVLDAALRILAERGFDATTLQIIADEVGRSKAGLLHHFGSREALMLAIVRHRDDVNRRAFPAGAGDDFSATLDLVTHNTTVPGLVALFSITAALAAGDPDDTDRRAYFRERYERNRAGFTRRLAEAQTAGTVRDDIPAADVASLLLAAMDGLQIQWLLDDGIDMAAQLSSFIRLIQPADARTQHARGA